MKLEGLISIIVPVYNAEKYLEKCIESIIHQTYQNYELILVDDGSCDVSWEIIKKYADGFSKIKGFRKENGGPNSARKKGLEMAAGEYVMFVDADDYVDPDICERLLQIIIEQKVDIVLSNIVKVLEDECIEVVGKWPEGKYTGSYIAENIINPEVFYINNIVMGLVGKLYKLDILKPIFKEIDLRINFSEDYCCLLLALLDSEYVYFLDESLYYYWQDNLSLTHKHLESNFESRKCMHQFLTKQLARRNASPVLYRQLEWVVIGGLLLGGYEAFREKDYLYPFKNVKKGSNIIIYGAGVFGGEIRAFLKQFQLCNLVLWVDQNWKKYQDKGFEVSRIEEIGNVEYDYIVVALLKINIAQKVKEELKAQGIDENKIEVMDQTLISYKELPDAFWK